MLPKLKWVPSPNFSARTDRVDLLVLHDEEGTNAGSIAYFQLKESQVSAHFCLSDDGAECVQMVHLADKAWSCCAFNSRSVSLEMAGYAKNGYSEALLDAAANIFAYLASHLQIPIRHARGGVGPGICSHFDLGRAGGGHADPSTDPAFMDKFIAKVQAAFNRHDFPASWDVDDDPKPCCLTPPDSPDAPATDLDTQEGQARALIALGYPAASTSDMLFISSVKAFQHENNLTADGIVGPATRSAILFKLSGG